MKKYIILFTLVLSAVCFSVSAEERITYNFNADWKLYIGDDSTAKLPLFDDALWKSVNLPYAFNENEAFLKPINELTDTVAWYRKTFYVPSASKGGNVFIEFEGVRQAAEVWVNGKWVGLHEDGVMAFGYDITKFLNYGRKPNVIAVRVDNSWDYRERSTGTGFQWNDRNFNANYGGITKNVYLHTTGKLYQTLPLYNNLKTTGIYIYANQFDIREKKAEINVESEVHNDYDKPKTVCLEVAVRDNEKLLVREFQSDTVTLKPGETKIIKATASMKNLQFWSWGFGYLYEVTTRISNGKDIEDIVKTTTGFRKTEFSGGMFKLNDRVLQLKGYAQRTTNEWPGVGMSVPAWLSDYSNNLMVDGNANIVRWMHVTPWKQDVESCDRVGLIEAMPAGDSEKDAKGRQWEQRTELMRDAIIYNRNNPSIVFYECGNSGISEEHMAEMKAIRDKYDPKGGRAIGAREMLGSKIAEYGGEMLYINKSAKKPVWAMEYCRDEALRIYWDDKSYPFHKQGDGPLYRGQDATAYNQNQDLFAKEAVVRWYDYWRERPGTGKRVSSGGTSIIFSDSNTHFRGAENYRRSGKVDAMRIPKDAYWANQVMWDGWVNTENYRTHIIGHWNYETGVHKDVYVVSSGDNVELFLNNKSLGFGQQSNHFLFTFNNVAFEPGTLRAVSYDSEKNVLSEDVLTTSGKPEAIKLTKIDDNHTFYADGADMEMAQVEVVDAGGKRCPLANDTISFEVSGPVEFIGGIAKGKDNFIRSKQLPVEAGVNRVLLRSTRQPGKITVIAKSGNLRTDTMELISKDALIKGGLSEIIQSNTLPCRLNRKGTPLSPSFKASRIPVSVLDAKAGSNEDDALLSYDDNEVTGWKSKSGKDSAWINYELSRSAQLSEICLKLSDWRNVSYHLRVLSERGDVMWEGETPKSLGYITLPIKKGIETRTVKIELVEPANVSDAFSSISEVDKNKDQKLKGNKKTDVIGIIEAEFYEKPTY